MKFRPTVHETLIFKSVSGFCRFLFRLEDISPNAVSIQEELDNQL